MYIERDHEIEFLRRLQEERKDKLDNSQTEVKRLEIELSRLKGLRKRLNADRTHTQSQIDRLNESARELGRILGNCGPGLVPMTMPIGNASTSSSSTCASSATPSAVNATVSTTTTTTSTPITKR